MRPCAAVIEYQLKSSSSFSGTVSNIWICSGKYAYLVDIVDKAGIVGIVDIVDKVDIFDIVDIVDIGNIRLT